MFGTSSDAKWSEEKKKERNVDYDTQAMDGENEIYNKQQQPR